MLTEIYISERFFTEEEKANFFKNHGYNITEVSYSSSDSEIDFSNPEEKSFLFQHGVPKILARFGV